MDLRSLLFILSSGEYSSGVVLGEKLGVSRTSIWKMIGKLEELDVEVECLKGKGYRIDGGLDLIDVDLIRYTANPQMISFCDVLLDADSTGNYLSEKLQRVELRPGFFGFCLSERQTAGRGRRGKGWISPFGKNIYLSSAYYYPGEVSGLTGLSLAIGVSVAEMLRKFGLQNVALKWPNDLIVGGKKVGGILVELTGELTQGCTVLIGVGLNVGMRSNEGGGIDQPWTSLFNEGLNLQRSEVAAKLIDCLVLAVNQFNKLGFQQFAPLWDRYDYLRGKSVSVVGSDLSGIGAGINTSGELLIQTECGIECVNAGEVSVRVSANPN